MSNKLTLSLTGTLKQSTRTITWNNDEQSEVVYKIKDTDGEITIDLSSIDNLALVYISSEDDTFIAKTTIGANIISQETDLFVTTFSAAFIATIDSFTISTSSTTDINVTVNLYGESS